MAIEIIEGLQGSGKSYYGTSIIYDEMLKIYKAHQIAEESGKEYDYKYKKIFTNIEGIVPNAYVEVIDIARLEQIWAWELKVYKAYEMRFLKLEFPDPDKIDFKAKKRELNRDIYTGTLEHEKLKEDIKYNHLNIAVKSNTEKDFLSFIETTKKPIEDNAFVEATKKTFEKHGMDHALFLIDEANNTFGNPLPASFKRLIQYHRHYHQDYHLICQSSNLLSQNVTQITAFTTKAINPFLRWSSKTFTYKVYSGGYVDRSDRTLMKKFSLRASEKIFSLYDSGGKKLAENMLWKKLGGFAVFTALIMAYLYYASIEMENSVKHGKMKQVNKINSLESKIKNLKKPKKVVIQTKIYQVQKINKFIISGKTKIKIEDFNKLVTEDKNNKLINTINNLDNTQTLELLLTDKTAKRLKIFKKEISHDKKNITNHITVF